MLLALSEDGSTLAAVPEKPYDEDVTIWRRSGGSRFERLAGFDLLVDGRPYLEQLTTIALSRDGRQVALSDGASAGVWESASGRALRQEWEVLH